MRVTLTPRAKSVVHERARGIAALLGQTLVGTEHVLLGIVLEGPSIAREVLAGVNVDVDRLRETLEKPATPAAPLRSMQGVVLGPDTERALRFAGAEARATGHRQAGLVHLLLGITHDPDCPGARVLREFGADRPGLRRRALDLLAEARSSAAAGGTPATKSRASAMNWGDKYTERFRTIVVLAREEAVRLGHAAFGPGHLLLGLLREGEGIGAAVLHNLGVDFDELRTKVEQGLGPPEALTPEAPSPAASVDTRMVLESATSEARAMGLNYVGSEHLLLGLTRDSSGLPAAVLLAIGPGYDRTRHEIFQLLRGPGG